MCDGIYLGIEVLTNVLIQLKSSHTRARMMLKELLNSQYVAIPSIQEPQDNFCMFQSNFGQATLLLGTLNFADRFFFCLGIKFMI